MYCYSLPLSLIRGCVSLQLKIIAWCKNCIVITETQAEFIDDKTKTSSIEHLGMLQPVKYNCTFLQLLLFHLVSFHDSSRSILYVLDWERCHDFPLNVFKFMNIDVAFSQSLKRWKCFHCLKKKPFQNLANYLLVKQFPFSRWIYVCRWMQLGQKLCDRGYSLFFSVHQTHSFHWKA